MMMMTKTMTGMVKMATLVTMMKFDLLSKSNKAIAEDHQFIYKHAPFTFSTVIPTMLDVSQLTISVFLFFLGHPRLRERGWGCLVDMFNFYC